jgi:hypothetical protein
MHDVAEANAVVWDWEEEERQARNQTLYDMVMVLHCVLSSPDERKAMAELNG